MRWGCLLQAPLHGLGPGGSEFQGERGGSIGGQGLASQSSPLCPTGFRSNPLHTDLLREFPKLNQSLPACLACSGPRRGDFLLQEAMLAWATRD